MRIILILLTLLLTSCSLLRPNTRAERYEDCAVRLLREGFDERYITSVCSEAHGSKLRRQFLTGSVVD